MKPYDKLTSTNNAAQNLYLEVRNMYNKNVR